MIEQSKQPSPLQAPLWRKLLALRMLLLSIIALAISMGAVAWFDESKPDVPKWLETVFIVLVCLPFFTFIPMLIAGVTDLAVHFLPEGKLKRLMVGKEKSSAQLADDFSKVAYGYALLPIYVWVGLLAVGLALVLLFGGLGLVSSLFSAAFAGWPSWAVVITILLVLLLLKK